MSDVALEQMKRLAESLSPSEKAQLAEWLNASLKAEQLDTTPEQTRTSLRGLWRGISVSDEDIEEVRREMWRNFPRDDF